MTLVDRACSPAVVTAICIIGSLTSAPPLARAQSAEAEALFRDGRVLIKRGKVAAGCEKLDASERLESSVGTLLNLGDCREKLGKLASAWAAFRKAEAMAKRSGSDDKRQGEAARRAEKLEPRLSNLVIEVPGRVARIEGLVVRRDGEVIDPALWNTALPIDPGRYTITAEAPGYLTWRLEVPIDRESRRQTVTLSGLSRAPAPVAASQPPPTVAPPATGSTVASTVIVRPAGTWSATRKLSAGLVLVGAGALGTGVYFGLHSKDLQDRADRRCPTAVCADPSGLRWNADARTAATRANVLYIAGGATVATAMVLWFVGAPDEMVVVPTAGDHQVGLSMTGSF